MFYDLYKSGLFSKEDDLFFLRKYNEYKNGKEDKLNFKYVYNKIDELQKYLPSEFFQLNDEFELMIKLMLWVHKFLIPDGDTIPIWPFNCLNILDKTKEDKIGSNCWMYSVVLNEIFLSFGYKSRMIRCMPFDMRFNDCHCVVQAYASKYDKQVTFDPAFGTYYTDTNGNPINLEEMRENIINEKKIITPFVPLKYSKELLNYWIKNIFRFETYAISKFNMESDSERAVIYSLLPLGYELTDKNVIFKERELNLIYTHDAQKFWKG